MGLNLTRRKRAETIGPVRNKPDRAAFSEREQERRAFWLLMASIVAMCTVMSLVTRSSRSATTGTLNDKPALAVANGTDAAGAIGGRLDLLEKQLDRMEREQRSANAAWLAIWERIGAKLPDYNDSGLRLPGIKGQVREKCLTKR